MKIQNFVFCPFCVNAIRIDFEKLKKIMEILSLYTREPSMKVIWCMIPGIQGTTDKIFCHFGPFFALSTLPLTAWEIKIWKLDKNTWRNYHFTHKYHIWQSFEFNVWLLRYGARHTEYFVILDCFCSFTPLVWYIFTSSTKNLYMVLMKKQKYNINFYKLFPTYDFS